MWQKSYKYGEDLSKPVISSFLKVTLENKNSDLKSMPLNNNTVNSSVDEMSWEVENWMNDRLFLFT